MLNLKIVELIKNSIKEEFGLLKCNLLKKENLQLVFYDKLSNEKTIEIAEYCKGELELHTGKKYKYERCCCSEKLHDLNRVCIFIYSEIVED